MIAEKNKVVAVSYELRKANGGPEVVDMATAERPLTFLFGHGNLLPEFEANLSGLKAGEKFDFVLTSEKAYGPLISEAIVDLPLSIFEVDGVVNRDILFEGNIVPMMDSNGNRLNGVVKSIGTDNVKMDFNHPMAGEDLHFIGEVVEVREASAEELSHGHIHQAHAGGCSGSCSEGGCNDSGCGDGGCCS